MKTCKDCGEDKNLSEYYTYRRATGTTYYARCKTCHGKHLKVKYTDEQRAVNRRNHRQSVLDFVNEKKNWPCLDCGKKYPPYVMDFDHVRGVKVKNLAKMIARNSLKEVKAEIEKCELVCSNCHRERTHQRKTT